MFKGEYNHSIDPKGRLIIPSKFRELLGEEFVMTKGLDGCLSIYPQQEWEAFEEKLRAGLLDGGFLAVHDVDALLSLLHTLTSQVVDCAFAGSGSDGLYAGGFVNLDFNIQNAALT